MIANEVEALQEEDRRKQMREEVTWWLETAKHDLNSARLLTRAAEHANAAFHCQQAGEKALKALLVAKRQVSRSHSSVELLELVFGEEQPETCQQLKGIAAKLDRQYIQARYPNAIAGDPNKLYDRAFVEELIGCALKLVKLVESELSRIS